MILDKICDMQNLWNVPPADPRWKNGKLTEETFTAMVDRLRRCSCPPIKDLTGLLWKIVGERIAPAAIMEGVPSMSFWCEVKKGEMFATIICPMNWCEMLKNDPHMQMGAIVFNASKAKDYWNQKVVGLDDTEESSTGRAWAYESEFLLHCQSDPSFSPNPYQRHVLGKFPKGVSSAPSGLLYPGRAFPDDVLDLMAAGPPFPVDVSRYDK